MSANPLSLWAYMRRMRRDPLSRVQERFAQYGDIYYAPFLRRDVYIDPERFLPERRKLLPQSACIPFGAGTRTCIGKQFALLEAQLILVSVAQRFTFEAASSEPVLRDMNVTLAPRGGLRMRVRARS